MSFFEWISRRPGFRSLEDSFAINRESMLSGLQRAIVQQQETCDEVWLVVHFFDAFVWLQDFLGRQGIEYEIADETLGKPEPTDQKLTGDCVVRLVLASLVVEPEPEEKRSQAAKRNRLSIAIIVCERHPYHIHDQRLFEAAKKINAAITFGYVLSLDDIVVNKIASPMTLQVLKQLGLDQNELIASHDLSRLLERRLIRDSGKYSGDHEAEAAAQWIQLNSR